jgi:hypothetical protein
VSSELLEALTSARAEVARRELELKPRWDEEKKVLVALELERDRARAHLESTRQRLTDSMERQNVLSTELEKVEVGLGRASKWWLRVLEPALVSIAILTALSGAAMAGPSRWPVLLFTLVVGLGLGRIWGTRRG